MRMISYRGEADYWRVRGFFRSARAAAGPAGGNWHVADFDYWRWHWLTNVVGRGPEDLLIWETPAGEFAGVVLQGDPGVVHLRIHPEHRTPRLEESMIVAAERRFATPVQDGERAVVIWTDATDISRRAILRERGYETYRSEHAKEHNYWVSLVEPIPEPQLPPGYIVRSMGDVDELPARSLASWRAFHPDEPDEGCEASGDWYRNIQRAPLYRRDLDVVTVAPNGELASFSVCYFDDVSRTAVLVLAGTVRAYQRRGLGKAAVVEMLRRIRHVGGTEAYVSSYDPTAHAFYESAGFSDCVLAEAWRKVVADS